MPSTQHPDTAAPQVDLRGTMHAMWRAVAPAWEEHSEFTDSRGRELTARLLELAAPARGDRVLELACGAGSLGLEAARIVAPGDTVLSDIAEHTAGVAARRAQSLGLTNVGARVLDIESIDEPDASFDVVFCREGLMFALDHATAAGELARVLRPGGRAAIAVWGPRERNPWLGLVMDAAAAQLGRPVPPPGIPGPFALSDGEHLASLLTGADLADVTVEELSVPLVAPSFDDWWARTTALAGPLAKLLANLPPDGLMQLRERARSAVGPYETSGGLHFPGVALVAAGTRKSA